MLVKTIVLFLLWCIMTNGTAQNSYHNRVAWFYCVERCIIVSFTTTRSTAVLRNGWGNQLQCTIQKHLFTIQSLRQSKTLLFKTFQEPDWSAPVRETASSSSFRCWVMGETSEATSMICLFKYFFFTFLFLFFLPSQFKGTLMCYSPVNKLLRQSTLNYQAL